MGWENSRQSCKPKMKSTNVLTINPLMSPPPPPPPLFRGGKLISYPSLLSPPPPSPSILHKQLTWTDQLWFIQVGNSYCFSLQSHDLQPHVLNFSNFTLYFSAENCYHLLIVRKSSITPGNHKSILEKPCSH